MQAGRRLAGRQAGVAGSGLFAAWQESKQGSSAICKTAGGQRLPLLHALTPPPTHTHALRRLGPDHECAHSWQAFLTGSSPARSP